MARAFKVFGGIGSIVGLGIVSCGNNTFFAKEIETKKKLHKEILIVGGGTGGLAVAAQIKRKSSGASVTVVDGAKEHFYQPGWTLVGAGLKAFGWTRRNMKDVIPSGVDHVPQNVKAFDPAKNAVTLEDGTVVSYDQLIVSTGVLCKWDAIPGLWKNIGEHGVCSNYAGGESTAIALSEFPKHGVGLFSQPSGAIKCGGAPQKALHLTWDNLHHRGIPMGLLSFITPAPALFSVAKYSARLQEVAAERGIDVKLGHELTEVVAPLPSVVPNLVAAPPAGAPSFNGFAVVRENSTGHLSNIGFHMLHVVPPQGPVAAVAASPLADKAGYVEVDKETLQHVRYPNVWALGDGSSVPTSKTASAICSEAPVVTHNVLRVVAGQKPNAKYNGYTSCPLIIGRYPRRLLLMEFGFGGKLMETFPWDQGRDDGVRGAFHYFLKSTVFPEAYWRLLLKGKWYGASHVRCPQFPDL